MVSVAAARLARFSRIATYFHEKDLAMLRQGRLPMRRTQKGFWGSTNLFVLYTFFSRAGLARRRRFCDLGCGDGRVVLVASLFTRAEGVEWDAALCGEAREAAKSLGMDVRIVRGDFTRVSLKGFDVFYSFPDNEFSEAFEEKLCRECPGGVLFVHDVLYRPKLLRRLRTVWVDQRPFYEYALTPRRGVARRLQK